MDPHSGGSLYNNTEGSVYSSRPQVLRRRSSGRSNQNYPQFNWGLDSTEKDEDDFSEPDRELRNIPLSMALKRAARHAQQTHAASSVERQARSLRRVKHNVKEVLYLFTLWRRSLQQISGNFGGGVHSYFRFLRFLVVLNFISFLLIAAFVLIPSIVFRSEGSSLVNGTGPEECMNYNPSSPGLVVFYNYFLDLLSGTGFLEYWYMFYGFYSNTMVGDSSFSYNIPLAYLFTAVFYFAFCLICIIARMGSAARVAIATGGSTVGNYSMIVFTSWDYGCLGDGDTKLKQNSVRYWLQVELEEERLKKKAAALSSTRKIVLYSARIFLALLSLGLIFAAFYCIFLATVFSQEKSGQGGILGLIFEYLPSIVITAGNFLVPLLCDQMVYVEQYSPSTTVIVALLRAVFLRLVSLGVLLYSLWAQITCDGLSQKCQLCGYNHELYQCWETRVGQEMYKLTLFDLLVNVAVLVLVEFPRRILVDNWSNKLTRFVGRQEFVVSSNVLGLVYGQTVVWAGALFCPLLPLINTIKFVILFYCKKITLFYNCRPAQKTFRSTTSTFFFLVVLFFGWALSLVVMIYSVAAIHPSMGCGPFRSFTNMWEVVPTSFHGLPEVTQEFLFFIGSQAFSIPLFSLSCVVMCYFIALAAVYGNSVTMLRAQLKLEGRDNNTTARGVETTASDSNSWQEHVTLNDTKATFRRQYTCDCRSGT